MERVQISICGRSYNLMSDDGAERITALAAELEGIIKEYTANLRNKSENEVLTLVALNVLDETGKEVEQLKQTVVELQAELENSEERSKQILSDNVISAGSELEQIAQVKDKENEELMKKITEYEKEFERLVEEKETEIASLKESFDSAKGEMEHIAMINDTDNAKLRNTLNSYETTFDLYVKLKEEEIVSLRNELEVKQTECDVLRQRIAALGDDGQMTIC